MIFEHLISIYNEHSENFPMERMQLNRELGQFSREEPIDFLQFPLFSEGTNTSILMRYGLTPSPPLGRSRAGEVVAIYSRSAVQSTSRSSLFCETKHGLPTNSGLYYC